MCEKTDWYGLYKKGWQGEIVPEAFSHPAKFARGLIRRIYEYAIEQGYLKEGDTVIDPFDGVALGALDAMFHGLHHIGVELEEKFVQLGQQNIDLWNRRYGKGLPRWGTAVLVQGDSRRLVEVLEGARAEGIIASPPFTTSIGLDGGASKRQGDYGHIGSWGKDYGIDPAQLGNMPTGVPPSAEPPQAVIGSPPHGITGVGHDAGHPRLDATEDARREAEGCERRPAYGSSNGQLAAMREGDAPTDYTYTPGSLTSTPLDSKAVAESATFTTAPKRKEAVECEWEEEGVDAVIGSPPFADSQQGRRADFVLDSTKVNPTPRKLADRSYFPAEMESEGQLAALPEGEPPVGIVQVDACVSSPPWEQSGVNLGDVADTPGIRQEISNRSHSRPNAYGTDPDQLGNQQGDTFWSAAKTILLQCHAVLAPGGVAIWVVKDFVRAKRRIDFTGQWQALCESCGFETIEVIKAWLVEERGTQYDLDGEAHTKVVERKSFFRRLYEFKAKAAKFWESVSRDDKASYLWHAHGELWQDYHRRTLEDDIESPPPLPTHTRILSTAQALAYREAGEPDVEIDTQIDYEVVLVMRKGDGEEKGEVVQGVVASPPFTSSLPSGTLSEEMVAELRAKGHGPTRGSTHNATYGSSPGQLAQMKEGIPPTQP